MNAPSAPPEARRVVLALGTAQTLAWASSYYLPAILAAPMARDLGIAPSWVFGAFSAALILSALLGPAVGRAIDVRGGAPYSPSRTWCSLRGSSCWPSRPGRSSWRRIGSSSASA